ncbi:MAG: hypothetical protein Q9157_000935 [Trypethelium eluteriae]
MGRGLSGGASWLGGLVGRAYSVMQSPNDGVKARDQSSHEAYAPYGNEVRATDDLPTIIPYDGPPDGITKTHDGIPTPAPEA